MTTPIAGPNADIPNAGGPHSLEGVALALSLDQIGRRLTRIEETTRQSTRNDRPSVPIELCRVIFGGWPVLGLVFLLLFYFPLRDALNAIPEKVRSAEEIGVLGVSLKTTIRIEAAKQGAIGLSDTLPSLSPTAIELLLGGSKGYNAMVSYVPSGSGVSRIWLPTQSTISALAELERKELIEVSTQAGDGTSPKIADFQRAIDNFKQANPGKEITDSFRDSHILWELNTPTATKDNLPHVAWQRTELGRKAFSVILSAIATELAPVKGPSTPRVKP